jgi:hypothetical protein
VGSVEGEVCRGGVDVLFVMTQCHILNDAVCGKWRWLESGLHDVEGLSFFTFPEITLHRLIPS